MEVLKLTTTIDASGQLNLSVPTQLMAGEVNVVVVVHPILPGEISKSRYDFSDLTGRLIWGGDAVAMQRTLRNEW
jgi:hypothetical protein